MPSFGIEGIDSLNRPMRRVDFNRGFTLLELIFVVTIVAVIVTMALPQFRETFDFLVARNFVFDVVSFARYAQAKAIIKRAPIRLVFDAEKKILKIESYSGTEKIGEEEIEIWRAERSKQMPDFVSVDLKNVKGGIKFYPNGTADKATITITISSGRSYVVSIEEMTGYVRYEEPGL